MSSNPSNPGSVVQDWLGERCSYRQQATVLSALRGCDGKSKNDPSKPLTRYFRGCILKPADPDFLNDPRNNYMRPPHNLTLVTEQFLSDLDHYPHHWVMHFTHAMQIVGYYHPDEGIRRYWLDLYYEIVHRMHLNPESNKENDWRLRDGRRTEREEA